MKLPIILLMAVALASLANATEPARSVELDAMLEPHQTVELRSPVEGLIKEIRVDRGEAVKKGQVLVVLESGPEEATAKLWQFRAKMEAPMKSASSRYHYSVKKEKRLSDLYGEEYASQADSEEALAERQLAEAQLVEAKENRTIAELELERANQALQVRTLKSPFNGVVMERFFHPGAVAVASEKKPILKLVALDPLYVEIVAPVALMGKIQSGCKIEVRPEVPPGAVYQATITQVDRVADAPSGTFGLRAELPNSEHRIAAGIKCKAIIPVQ